VTDAGWESGYGNTITIDHGYGIVTKFAHTSKILVRTGQRVSRGQRIALVGNTGLATGPHLHYEFLVDGVHKDPRTIAKTVPIASTIRGAELAAFRQTIRQSSLQLASLRSDSQLALNNANKADKATN